MENIKIVGTSHISSQSLNEIKKTFLQFQPSIIAVELDKDRLFGLQNPNMKNKTSHRKLIKHLGLPGYFFAMIGKYVQKKLGSIVNLTPGEDMLFAANLAKNNNLQLELIDRPINITLKRFSNKFGIKEIFQIIKNIFKGIFSKKNKINIDLKKIPEQELIDFLISEVKKDYPSIYSVIIEERNHYMAKKLIILSKQNKNSKILAVVGAGHKKEMEELLEIYNTKIEVI